MLCEPEVALVWDLTPNQSIFGHNVNKPSVLTYKVPALQPTTSNGIVRKNMNALHSVKIILCKQRTLKRSKEH